MNTASWEQIKSMFQSMSKVLFGNIASVDKKADDAQQAAANAQKKANDAQSVANEKLDKYDPRVIGSFAMNTSGVIGNGAFAAGMGCDAQGEYSHAEGQNTRAYNACSHAEGAFTKTFGHSSHAEGNLTETSGFCSHAEGYCTKAVGQSQHVQGEYNIIESAANANARAKYAHIVGNGTGEANRSNAYTLDWDGNGWFAGTVEGTGLILKSSTAGSEKRFLITVNDSGSISAAELTEA